MHACPMPASGRSVLDEWRDAARPFFEIKPVGDRSGFFGQATFTRAGPLVVSKVWFSTQRMEHDPCRLKGVDHEFLLFERYRSGAGRGLVGGEQTRVDTRVMHLVDMSRHYVTMTTDVTAEGVLIPHAAVGYDPSAHDACASVPLDSERGIVLGQALDSLCDAFGPDPRFDAEDLGAAFGALVRTVLLGEADDPDEATERGRTRLLRDYVQRHLDDPSLGAERICRDLGMSRASLYRVLAEEGGVRTYITNLRLDRCFGELLQSAGRRGQVRAVAERWGFFDAANFSHGFRRRFGVAPSDCLGSAGTVPHPAPWPGASRVPRSPLDWVCTR